VEKEITLPVSKQKVKVKALTGGQVAQLPFDLELEVNKAAKEGRFLHPEHQAQIVKVLGFNPEELHYLDMRTIVDAVIGLTLVPDFLERNSGEPASSQSSQRS
jgi:hypothetical protein